MEPRRITERNGHPVVISHDTGRGWEAFLDGYDGAPDTRGNNSKVGFGLSEEEAIQDLLSQLDGD